MINLQPYYNQTQYPNLYAAALASIPSGDELDWYAVEEITIARYGTLSGY